jgi:hypothetical protein
MNKLNILGAGIAVAVTFALLSILCALAFVLAPNGTIDFFGAFMHGLDLNSVRSTAPIRLGRVLYGVRPIDHWLHRGIYVRLDVQSR